MSGDVRVGVVICCYTEDRWDEIVAAVASVRAQTRPPDALVVVVDHHPALLGRLAGTLPRDVRVVPNLHAPGLSGARNTGVAVVGTDVVAFLDDDAVADPDWLEHLAAEYADPRVTAVGGRIDPLWTGGRPGWFPPEFDWVVGCSYRGQPAGRAVVRNVIGANMSFRRAPVLDAGGFAEELGRDAGALPLGGEETELCIRLTARTGGAVVHQPRARVRHRVAPARGTLRYFRRRCFAEGVSKAAVGARVGSGAALAAERGYAARVLPAGVARDLRDGLRHADPAALGRAGAIVLGLAATTGGYAVGRWRR